jgi:esterase/lipase
MTQKAAGVVIIAVVGLLLGGAVTSSLAQPPPTAVTPPTGTELVDSEQIIRQIRNMLFYSQLEDYRLYENGTAEYTIRLTTSQDAPMNNTITVITEHEYTPANRYVFDNTTGDIITPQGEKLVISTFDE